MQERGTRIDEQLWRRCILWGKTESWWVALLMAGRVFPKMRQHPAADRCSWGDGYVCIALLAYGAIVLDYRGSQGGSCLVCLLGTCWMDRALSYPGGHGSHLQEPRVPSTASCTPSDFKDALH